MDPCSGCVTCDARCHPSRQLTRQQSIVMRRSIAEVLQRGDRLEDVSQLSSRIASESKKYARNANQLNLQLLWHQYGPLAIVAVVVILFVYIRWFWM